MDIEQAIIALQKVLGEMGAEDFCGCHEGDLANSYAEGCIKLVQQFRQALLGSKKTTE